MPFLQGAQFVLAVVLLTGMECARSLRSFVPKNLFEFFRVVANCYFLLISVLQVRFLFAVISSRFPLYASGACERVLLLVLSQVGTNLSPTNPYTTITPLTVVLIITMIKQGIEDFKRHVADHVMNNRSTNVIRQGKLQCVSWKDVETGDLLLVHDREELPADIVILSTSEELGKCFIEVRFSRVAFDV
jgi:magnesium-transporting ATPase (P-type)